MKIMDYKVLAGCNFAGKLREVGEIIPASIAEKDPCLNYYLSNGSLEKVESKQPKKESKK